jgi:hypothetical protein
MKQNKRHRGSVLLLVIGLLTIIAMLGSMLLLVSRLDRQTSQAIADTAPERRVAESVLERLLANRLADLYINNTSNVIYGDCNTTDPNIAERQIVDYPAEPDNGVTPIEPNQWFDGALACIEPTSGTWRHVSHLNGITLPRDPNDVPIGDANLVNTDGDDANDALLFDTGIRNREGGSFFAAVRMIDAAGLLNVNTAGTLTRNAEPNQFISVSDCNMGALPLANAVAVVSGRSSGLYDMGDMLAMSRRIDPNVVPATITGRLASACGFTAVTAGTAGWITTVSSSKAISPPLGGYSSALKVNPNDPSVSDPNLYHAFLAMLTAYDSNPGELANNKQKAAWLTVNLRDYIDPNGDPNRIDASTLDANFTSPSWYYGVERHPFVSKVFLKKTFDTVGGTVVTPPISALELINPYAVPIPLDNYTIGGVALTGKTIAANGGRFVAYSNNFPVTQIDDIGAPDPNSRQQLSIDATSSINIMWRHPTGGWSQDICVDQTPAIDNTLCPQPDAGNLQHWRALFRDDRLANARYSLGGAVSNYAPSPLDDAIYDYSDTTTPGPKMGLSNPIILISTLSSNPTPVYVRDANMIISLGDMMRLFVVGPTNITPLSGALASPGDHQLLPSASTPLPTTGVHVPVGCLVTEYFNLLPADANHNVQGLININTAPRAVLKCLPGIASAPDPNALVNEIIAYRDMTAAYSTNRAPAGITNLRNQPGFAFAGEVAIPLRVAGGVNNTYGNTPPNNYAVADGDTSDDGLAITDPNRVQNDPIKFYTLYSWLANQVTVRSNVYIAYIRVQVVPAGRNPATPWTTDSYRCYVAVIDRGNCTTATTKPRVLLFTELQR